MTVTDRLPAAAAPATASTTGRTLRVAALRRLADGVVEATLADPDGGDLPAWEPGAHIDLHLGDDGALVRQYSLCGDPRRRDVYQVAVLREDDGRGGSRWLHDHLAEGALVEVSEPRNHFALVPATSYLLVAGGIGITPVLAMAERLEADGTPWRLLYGGRTRTTMAYLDRLAGLDPDGTRVTIAPQDEAGLLDLAGLLGEVAPGAVVYGCGPAPLLDALEQATAHWPAGSLHVERFAADEEAHRDGDTTFEVVFDRSGVTAPVPPGTSIVDVATAAGIFVPQSCSEGVCGTCETLVLDGEPDHRDALFDEADHAEGAFAPCVSRARSARLVLDL